jgi:phage-related protein/acid phosphatase family membrane protein YuiD
VATTVAKLQAVLEADTSHFDRGMDKSQSRLGGFAKAALFTAGGAGLGALAFALKAGVSEFQSNAKEAALTAAVIKSTGGAANVTSQHVQSLATSLMKKTGIDDEAIASGQNLLLTFTNIRNEAGKGNKIFDQATGIITDLSVALGQDFKQSAIQVGKALQDPLTGMTALRRVGVSFTKVQMDAIKALLGTGKTAKEVAKDQADASKLVESAQKAQSVATEHVVAAQDALKSSAEKVKSAQDAVRTATEHLTDAQHGLKTAHDDLTTSHEKLIASEKDAKAAEEGLTGARRQAKIAMEDLRNAVVDAHLNQEDAAIRVARAEERLWQVMDDSKSTDLDKREAQLSLVEAQRDYKKSQDDATAAQSNLNDAEAKGIEKSPQVLEARKKIADAHNAVKDAAAAVVASEYAVQQANQKVGDQAIALEKAERGVADAQAGRTKAQAALTKAQADASAAAGRLAAAQKNLAVAQNETVKTGTNQAGLLKAQKMILHELQHEFGGAAEAVGKTLPGQLAILHERFNNFAGDMVAKAIPAIARFTSWIKDHWPEVSAVVRRVWEQDLKPVLDATVAWFREHWPEIAAIVKQIWEQDLKPTLTALIQLAIGIVAAIRDNWGTIGPVVQAVGSVVRDAVTVITSALRLVIDLLRGDWSAAWGDLTKIVGGTFDSMKTIITTMATLLGKLAAVVGNAIKDGIEAPIIAMRNFVTGKAGPLLQIVNMFEDLPGQLRAAIQGGANQITGSITAMLTAVRGGMDRVVGAITDMFNVVKNTFANIPGEVTAAIRGAVNAVAGFADNAFRAAKSIGAALFDGIKDGFAGVDGALVRIFKGAVNAVIGAWNAFKIPGFHIHVNLPKPIPDINFDTPDISFPNIPFLARGGSLRAGQLSVVGERGPELFAPATAGTVIPSSGVGPPIVVNIQGWVGNDQAIAEKFVNELTRWDRRNGGRLGFA